QLVGEYTNPILKPQAAEFVKKHGEMELSGAGSPTPTNQCWPEPVPYIFWTVAMRMLQLPDKIIILYGDQVRHVRMNEAHPARATPSLYGDSVGRYEGDMLVVDTVGIRTDRPFAMGRHVWHALHPGPACGGTLSAARLRSGERRVGTRRKRKFPPSPGYDSARRRHGPELSGQAPATPIHGRGRRRLYDAVVGDHNVWASTSARWPR